VEYTDGGIHREGDPTVTGGAYSAGRGGAGNIGSPRQLPVSTGNDDDIVPEAAKVQAHDGEPYHSGRGGEGNAQVPDKGKPHTSFADRLRKRTMAFFGAKK